MAMMLSVMVVGAGAAFTDQEEIVNTDAVDMCVALNIIGGYPDGSYMPEGNITRAQACKLICIALNGGKEPVLGTNATPSFADIDGNWAEAYIEYCYSEGIVSGVGSGKFNPNGNVTGVQFAKMLLTALGYESEHEKFTGDAWAVNVNVKASQKDLYDEIETMDPAVALSRDNAAQMVWNTLQSLVVYYDYTLITNADGSLSSQITVEDRNYDLLADKYEAMTFVGTFEGNYNTGNSPKGEVEFNGRLDTEPQFYVDAMGVTQTNDRDVDFPCEMDITDIGEEFQIIFIDGKGGTDYSPDKKDTILGIFKTGGTTVYNITKGDLQDPGATNLGKGKIKFDDTLYDVSAVLELEDAIVTNYGIATVTGDDLDSTADNDDGTAAEFATYLDTTLRVNSADPIKFIEKDGKIVKAYVENWTYTSVLKVSDTKVQLEGIGSFDVEDVNFIDEVDSEDIVAYALFYGSVNEHQVMLTETISGTVEAINDTATGTKVQVDGTWYKQSVNTENLNDYNTTTFTVGDEYAFVLDGAYWVAADPITVTTEYAMVLKSAAGITDQVHLLLADGNKKVFDIHEDSVLQQAALTAMNADPAQAVLVKYELASEGTAVKMTAVETPASGGTHSYDDDTRILTLNGVSPNKVISDTAVAFVFDVTNSKWKAYNANDIKDMSSVASGAYTNAYYAVKDGKVTAYSMIVTSQPTAVGAGTGYGYITGRTVTKDDKNNDIIQLSIWNGTDTVTVTVDGKTTTTGHAVGNFVKYTVSDKAVDRAEVVAGTNATVKVKEYDANRNLVITTAGTYSVSGTIVGDVETVYVMDKDSVIIGVETDREVGAEYSSIVPFTKVSGSDYQNAHIIYEVVNGDNIIKAIFVDVDNALDTNGTVAGGLAGAAGTSYAVAVPTIGTVTGSGYAAGDFTVTADKTRAIAGEVVTYTITYNGTADANDVITLTLTATGSASVVNASGAALTGLDNGESWTCTATMTSAAITASTVDIAVTVNP